MMAERELLIEGRAKATIKIKMLIVTITQPVKNCIDDVSYLVYVIRIFAENWN